MEFQQVDITGCRLVGALSILGHIGPKHHGVIIGRSMENQKVYVAEHCHTGYRLSTYGEFLERYSDNGEIRIQPNDGKFSDTEVANRAINELTVCGQGNYNLLFNNCESFSNRAINGSSISSQVINTFTVTALCIGSLWLVKQARKG